MRNKGDEMTKLDPRHYAERRIKEKVCKATGGAHNWVWGDRPGNESGGVHCTHCRAYSWADLRQGRCLECKVAFRWDPKLVALKDAYCPDCGAKLQRTTDLFKGPWYRRPPARRVR